MKRKLISGLLASAMVLSSLVIAPRAMEEETHTYADDAAPMILQYDEPASSTKSSDTWKQASLPIGNGIIGANVFGELSREHLTVNEETLWSGGRGSVSNYNGGNPASSVVGTYNNYANQLLNGSILTNVEGLRGVAQAQSGYNYGYQALGDLYFDIANAPSSRPSDYRRTLDLDNGLATVSYGSFSRTFFVSNPDNVLVSRFEGSSVGLTVSFACNTGNNGKKDIQTTSVVKNGVGYITVSGKVSNNDLLYNTQIAVAAQGGTVTAANGSVTVSGASSVTVYLTAATDYKNTFWDEAHTIEYYYRTGETAEQLNARVAAVLNKAVNKGYASVLRAHTEDYKSLYDRVKLDLGQSSSRMTDDLLRAYQNGTATAAEERYLEVLMFQYGRYLLISGSRENSQLPTNLQGIWNDSNNAAWYADIHTNINEQMNYWLSNNCNLTECALPLVQYIADLAIPGGRTVKTYTGSDHGIMAHTQNIPYGYTAPGYTIGTWGWSPAASTWLMQNCYDYYEFSGDTETLRNVIYPFLKDQVLMYNELLKPYNGRLVMPITQSPEINIITAGNTYEQSLIWQLYADTIEAAGILGVDEDLVPAWRSVMEQLKPIEIGESGQVKEWYHETRINSVSNTTDHRHLSNMLGLYPGNLFDTEELYAAARVSLNNKNFGHIGTTGLPMGGWSYGQLINSWARLSDGENAYFSIKQMIQRRLFVNLWDYHDPAYFQIDANYGYSAGVGEMLVQSNLGYINLLPAIPSVWADGAVSGLLCEGNFEISMEWADGSLVSGTITSGKGGDCSVKLQPGMVLKNAGGSVIARYNAENPIVTFATGKGDVFTVESVALRVTANRAWDGSVTLNWNAQPGETYSVAADGTVIASGIEAGTYTDVNASANAVTYTVSCEDDAAEASVEAVITGTNPVQAYVYELVTTSTVENGTYLILTVKPGIDKNALNANRSSRQVGNFITDNTISEFDGIEAYEWEFKNVSGGITVKSADGKYLEMNSQDSTLASMSDSPVTLNLVDNTNYTNAHGIYNPSTRAYLNFRNSNNTGTWRSNDQNSSWYLYKKVPVIEVEYKKTTIAELTDGIYIMTGSNSGANRSLNKAVRSDMVMQDITDYIRDGIVKDVPNAASYLWEIKSVPGTSDYTVRSLAGGVYLEMNNSNVTVASTSSSSVNLTIRQGNTTGTVCILNTATGAFLNYRNGNAGTWTQGDAGSSFYLYKQQNLLPVFTISEEVLASAQARLGAQNEVLAAARAVFSSQEDAEDAYRALVEAVKATLCAHEDITFEGYVEPTCTRPGQTGTAVCLICGEVLAESEEIPAQGHTAADERTHVVTATCTETGYTGNVLCARCGYVMEHGTVQPALGHEYHNGECIRCHEAEPGKAPLEIEAAKGSALRLSLTGTYNGIPGVTNITTRGIVLIPTARLGQQELTVNTPGRTNVIIKSIRADGTWVYTFLPTSSKTEYTVRSYIVSNGVYYYSEPMVVSYNRA